MTKKKMSEQSHVRFANALKRQQEQYAPDQVNMAAANGVGAGRVDSEAIRAPNVMDEQFPTDALTQKDKRDEIMSAKLDLQGKDVGYTPFGQLVAKDEDFQWLLRKQAAEERANMEAWFAKNFDFMSPAQKAHARKLFPEFYEARKRLLRKQTDNVYDLARIKLDGIQDIEDAKKMYLVETGRLDLGPLQNILHPESVNGDKYEERNRARFQRGIANPFLVFGKMAEPMNYETRKAQSKNFAARAGIDANAKLGIEDTGFPPFQGSESNQGTADWYKNLTEGLARVNIASSNS